MTELFLIRHARAADQSSHDWERSLTAEGRREARVVGAALRPVLERDGVRIATMAASPLVRAVETATLLGVEVGYDGALRIDHALTPDGTVEAMIDLANELEGEHVALVGHEPSMGHLLSALVGRPGMSLVKGAVVRLGVDGALRPGGTKLVWTMSPRHLVPVRGG